MIKFGIALASAALLLAVGPTSSSAAAADIATAPSRGQIFLMNTQSNPLYYKVAKLIGADPNGTGNLTSPPFLLSDNKSRIQIVVAPDNRILEVIPVPH